MILFGSLGLEVLKIFAFWFAKKGVPRSHKPQFPCSKCIPSLQQLTVANNACKNDKQQSVRVTEQLTTAFSELDFVNSTSVRYAKSCTICTCFILNPTLQEFTHTLTSV